MKLLPAGTQPQDEKHCTPAMHSSDASATGRATVTMHSQLTGCRSSSISSLTSASCSASCEEPPARS